MSFLGTLNPEALKLPVLQKKSAYSAYEEISKLSSKAEELQKENIKLEDQLNAIISEPSPNGFYLFKKWQIELGKRFIQRDKELNEFAKHLDNFRKQPDSSFVEIEASFKPTNYDPIVYSLMVSNSQMSFFSKGEMEEQNQNLRNLIESQQETLSNLNARLHLYDSYQNKSVIKQTIDTLRRGSTPQPLACATPTRSIELRTKKKVLKQQLQALTRKRKEIMASKIALKIKAKEELVRIKKIILIQSAIRGYLARQRIKRMHRSAIVIQKFVRGFLVRLRIRKNILFDSENQSVQKQESQRSHESAE